MIADKTAEAPGIGETSRFASIAVRIRIYQGSLIPGVPASEISAIFFPSCKRDIILSTFVTQE